MKKEKMDRVKALVDRISPLLHRHSEAVQSAVLADLLAKWIAGHVVLGDPLATTLLRGKLLREHMKLVRVAREPSWQEEGWAIPAMIEEFARLYSDFHRDALDLIHAISPGTLFFETVSHSGNTPKVALPRSVTLPIL
jgi:hypothetical protein